VEEIKVSFRTEKFRHHFEDILLEWVKLVVDFSNKYDSEDSLYWYNERATLSSLAGAMWRNDCFVLEELSIDKFSNRGEEWPGRADMWLLIGNTEYIIESKQVWVSLSKRASATHKKIITSLKDARKDAVNAKWNGSKALGMTFVTPRIPPSEVKYKEQYVAKFQRELKKFDYDFMAYAFPNEARVLSTGGYSYPGVALLARVPKR